MWEHRNNKRWNLIKQRKLEAEVIELRKEIRAAQNIRLRGAGVQMRRTPHGVTLNVRRLSATGHLQFFKVVSDADGKGYYNCSLVKFDAPYWNTDTNCEYTDESGTVVVFNLGEGGSSEDDNILAVNQIMIVIKTQDDEGNEIYVGFDIISRFNFGVYVD